MTVLFVCHSYLNGNGGGVYASRAYINALSALGYNVTVLYAAKKGLYAEDINENVVLVPVYNKKNEIAKGLDFLFGNVHRFKEIFCQQLEKKQFDIVIFNNSICSFRLIDVAHSKKIKVITIHHNYEKEYVRDNSKWYLRRLSLFWTKKYERESVLKSDLSLTITEQDRALLYDNYDSKFQSVIKTIGCFEYKERDNILNIGNEKRALNFVITGNLSAIQTEKSLESWFDYYYPIFKKVLPNAKLLIAGKDPSEFLKSKCMQLDIAIIASPPDMNEILSNADFYICPTELGGGLKLRIMDGLRYGLPVLTHEVSARGYEVFKEMGCLFSYSDLDSFEKGLKNLIKVDYEKQSVVELYNSIFSFSSGKKRLKKMLELYI